MSKVDLKDYEKFVAKTISPASSDVNSFLVRLNELVGNSREVGVRIPELITAQAGLTAEAGEFGEVVKKIVFQGKPLSDENVFHMKRELGDICWYLAVACKALNTSLDDILAMNVEKLSARYPEGFEIIKSEVRKEGDL